jgi:hypothetical protein
LRWRGGGWRRWIPMMMMMKPMPKLSLSFLFLTKVNVWKYISDFTYLYFLLSFQMNS